MASVVTYSLCSFFFFYTGKYNISSKQNVSTKFEFSLHVLELTNSLDGRRFAIQLFITTRMYNINSEFFSETESFYQSLCRFSPDLLKSEGNNVKFTN